MRPTRRRAAALAGAAVWAIAASGEPSPVRGGAELLEGALESPVCVVGRVRAPERIDPRAGRARLEVTRVLRGALAPGAQPEIAWEERLADAPLRFAEGERILVALGPAPGGSLWRKRLAKRPARVVARTGDAFLRDPDDTTADGLARVLAVDELTTPDGVAALANLVAVAAEPVARAALERLGTVPGLAERLDAGAGQSLAGAAADPDRSLVVRRRTLDAIGSRKLRSLRPAVVPLAKEGSPVAPEAVEALAQLDGGIDAERVPALLARPEPRVRAAALRWAPASLEPDPALAALDDPHDLVRASAVTGLVSRRGLSAFDAVSPALGDPDTPVRAAAVTALAALGAEAVPPLRDVAMEGPPEQATGALLALARAGQEGRQALRGIAASHPDERVRGLARFLLGAPPQPH